MRSTTRAAAGALALAAAMGIGRFAYTALLPPTQAALGFDDRAAGAIASLNLLGYLAGALVARVLRPPAQRVFALRAGLAATAVATALLAWTTGLLGWGVLRTASGVASGLVFVLGSAAALEPGDDGAPPRPGLLFAGVGAGIALSGVMAAALSRSDWRVAWLVLAVAAAALGAPAWRILAVTSARGGVAGPGAAPREGGARASIALPRLASAYFLEGLGYIVSGTFAVVAVQRTPGLEGLAAWTWALAGLAAIPSALAWTWLGGRTGLRAALAIAFAVQAAGMALPSISASAAAAIAGAVLFGGTFMGITALTMTAAREIAPAAVARLIASLTVLYGVGQVIGPIVAGAISRRAGDPRPAVLAAALAVGVGGAIVAWPPRRR
ncbi:MAG TPA: YbfB/YjiJ family MFS transporter [Anaeromyxobacteraceae bacterium]|nr:YbfB/YjiJ family MFS transporter [Anaeromyxobacteraceae bacterium]